LVFLVSPLQTGKSTVFMILFISFFLFYYIFIGRFYKIEVDSIYLYYDNYKKKGKIAFGNVISIKDEALPYSFFFKTAYGITIRYSNEQGKVKKLKFLSPETSWGGHPFQIPELKYLKSKIVQN
jgi:hypothetical protein